MVVLFGMQRITRSEPIITKLRRRLNESTLIPLASTRAYVYSNTDELVLAPDVERHADDAESKGYNVRMEMFEETAHVAHVMKEPTRYWKVVSETYNAGLELSGG